MSVAKKAGRMSAAVSISRVLGLVREQVFAHLFGAGLYSDAFLLAFRIPNLFRDFFAEGAFGAAFVSVFAKENDEKKRIELARKVSVALSICLLVLLSALFFFAPSLVMLLASDFAEVEGKFELSVFLTRMLLPFLYFASMAALCMGILNTFGSFFIPSMGSAAFNASSVFIGGGLGLYFLNTSNDSHSAIVGFAVGALCGGLLQWFIQLPKLKSYSIPAFLGLSQLLSLRFVRESFQDPKLRRIMLIMAPSLVAVAAMQINVTVNTFFATSLEQGSVSWLVYAYRLVHFPMGVFGVAISIAALPSLAKVSSDMASFEQTLKKSIRLSSILAVGSAFGLYFFAAPLVSLIFEHGRFDFEDTLQTSAALGCYAVGLFAFSVNKTLLMSFYAREKVWTPALVSASSVLSNFVFAYYLSKSMGHEGLALSVSLSSTINTLVLLIALRLQGVRAVDWAWCRLMMAALISAIPMLLLWLLDVPNILLRQRFDHYLVFGIGTLALVALLSCVYLFLLSLLSEDGRFFWSAVRERIRKR